MVYSRGQLSPELSEMDVGLHIELLVILQRYLVMYELYMDNWKTHVLSKSLFKFCSHDSEDLCPYYHNWRRQISNYVKHSMPKVYPSFDMYL